MITSLRERILISGLVLVWKSSASIFKKMLKSFRHFACLPNRCERFQRWNPLSMRKSVIFVAKKLILHFFVEELLKMSHSIFLNCQKNKIK